MVRLLLAHAAVAVDELVVDVGAGEGALTLPLARGGARVLAVEVDPVLVTRLRSSVAAAGLGDRVEVRADDLRRARWPAEPYRVVANPPFGLTSALLQRLLSDPSVGPSRLDLVVQAEVARERARQPPVTLRGASVAPWWEVREGPAVDRRAFRPVPRVDAAVLTVVRRDPPVLPVWMAPLYAEAVREAWARR